MIVCLLAPEWSALAARISLKTSADVVVIGGGRVTACTQGAANAGIRCGDPVGRVKQLCPDAVVVTRSASAERAAWEEVVSSVYGNTPFLYAPRPGLLWADVQSLSSLVSLVASTGLRAGTASERNLALLAAAAAESGGCVQAHTAPRHESLKHIPVTALLNLDFAEDMVEKLTLFGLKHMDAVERLTERHLTAQFGGDGRRLSTILHEQVMEGPPLYLPPPEIRIQHRFDDACREPGPLVELAELLAIEAAGRLGNLQCGMLTMEMTLSNGSVITATDILSTATCERRLLSVRARRLLSTMLNKDHYCEYLVVRLRSLSPAPGIQIPMFRQRPDSTAVARAVNRRYPGSIFRIKITDPGAYLPEQGFTKEEFS